MNNKPFDPTKPVSTRSGLPARVIAYDINSINGAIAAVVISPDGSERLRQFHADGRFIRQAECSNDLINIPVKRTRTFFLNIYGKYVSAAAHDSLAQARLSKALGCVACGVPVTVEFEEGQGL